MRKDHNLNNPNAEPEHTSLEVACTVHLDMGCKVPVDKLQQWLESLPRDARVRLTGVMQGKARFEATWTEQR